MNYLSNAFSLNMLGNNDDVLFLRKSTITPSDIPTDVFSIIGDKDFANIVSNMLGFEVPFNRTSVTLHPDDTVFVIKYIGPQLSDGATVLPRNSKLKFFMIQILDDPCKSCRSSDCDTCMLKLYGFAGKGKDVWF